MKTNGIFYQFYFLAILFFSTLVSNNVSASIASNKLCNGCSSTQMKNTALAAGAGEVHVMDLESGLVLKYDVNIERESGFEMRFAMPMTPDANIVQSFSQAQQAYTQIRAARHRTDIYYEGSPYDLSGSSQAQNNFQDYVANNLGFEDLFFTYTYFLMEVIPSAPNLSVVLTINFTEGGTADVLVTGINNGTTQSGADVAVIGAKDSENNGVPFTKSQFNATYNMADAGNQAGFSGAAARNSVTINIPPGGVSSGGGQFVTTITCSTTNGETTCTESRVYVR